MESRRAVGHPSSAALTAPPGGASRHTVSATLWDCGHTCGPGISAGVWSGEIRLFCGGSAVNTTATGFPPEAGGGGWRAFVWSRGTANPTCASEEAAFSETARARWRLNFYSQQSRPGPFPEWRAASATAWHPLSFDVHLLGYRLCAFRPICADTSVMLLKVAGRQLLEFP